jgi:hypothetical protein
MTLSLEDYDDLDLPKDTATKQFERHVSHAISSCAAASRDGVSSADEVAEEAREMYSERDGAWAELAVLQAARERMATGVRIMDAAIAQRDSAAEPTEQQAMTVGMLRQLIAHLPADMPVVVGLPDSCERYGEAFLDAGDTGIAQALAGHVGFETQLAHPEDVAEGEYGDDPELVDVLVIEG